MHWIKVSIYDKIDLHNLLFLHKTGSNNRRPCCIHIHISAFVLDLLQRYIRWAFSGTLAFTGRKPVGHKQSRNGAWAIPLFKIALVPTNLFELLLKPNFTPKESKTNSYFQNIVFFFHTYKPYRHFECACANKLAQFPFRYKQTLMYSNENVLWHHKLI